MRSSNKNYFNKYDGAAQMSIKNSNFRQYENKTYAAN